MGTKNKGLYWALITTFIILYISISIVSTLHAITFFQLANPLILAILLGASYEIGQSAVLFSILMTENKNRILAWFMMFLLSGLQITANVYSSFKFMDLSGSNDWTYWQRSILFFVQAESPEMYKVTISWIEGALLPIISLGLTALVSENIRLVKGEITTKTKEIEPKEEQPLFNFNIFKKKDKKIDDERIETIINNEVEKRLDEKFQNNLNKEQNNKGENLEEEQYISETEINPNNIEENKLLTEQEQIPTLDIQTETKSFDKKPRIYKKGKNGKFKRSPSNTIKGWHLLNEFVDKEFNIFKKGKFVKNDPTKTPTESKKA